MLKYNAMKPCLNELVMTENLSHVRPWASSSLPLSAATTKTALDEERSKTFFFFPTLSLAIVCSSLNQIYSLLNSHLSVLYFFFLFVSTVFATTFISYLSYGTRSFHKTCCDLTMWWAYSVFGSVPVSRPLFGTGPISADSSNWVMSIPGLCSL
jgi:hypothetical protein